MPRIFGRKQKRTVAGTTTARDKKHGTLRAAREDMRRSNTRRLDQLAQGGATRQELLAAVRAFGKAAPSREEIERALRNVK